MAKITCMICSRKVDLDEEYMYSMVNENYVPGTRPQIVKACADCTRESKQCGECNVYYRIDVPGWVVRIGNGTYCRKEGCLDARFWSCEQHGWVRKTQACATCGLNEAGERPRCACGQGGEDSPVHAWNCQPTLMFHSIDGMFKEKDKPAKNMFMGVELEIQIPSSHVMNAAKFLRATLQTTEIAQCKNDGSIGGGVELVTQPHTYEKYREQDLFWSAIDEVRNKYGGRSWDPGTCGFHIHLGRDGFEDTSHLHRFVEFIYRNPEMMMKFGGRTSGYAKFDDCWIWNEFDQPVFSLENKGLYGTESRGGEKYSAVNTSKLATIEMRFMRGTTKKESLLAYIGMAHAIFKYTEAQASRDDWYDWELFNGWVTNHQDAYPELYDRMPTIKELKISDLNNLKIKA